MLDFIRSCRIDYDSSDTKRPRKHVASDCQFPLDVFGGAIRIGSDSYRICEITHWIHVFLFQTFDGPADQTTHGGRRWDE